MKKPPVNLTMCSSPRLETRGIACNFQGFDERTSEKKEEVEDGLLLQAGIIPREVMVHSCRKSWLGDADCCLATKPKTCGSLYHYQTKTLEEFDDKSK